MKKIVKTLLIAFLVIMAAVIFKNLYSSKIPIGNRGIKAAVDAGDLKVLLIGSSTFRSNVDMPMMDDAFDGKVFDISYGGNQCVAVDIQYDEIRKRSDNTYDLMLFELGPLMLTEEVMLSDSRIIWDMSWDGKKRLWSKMYESGNTDLPMMYEYFVTSGFDDLITYPVTEPIYATRYYKGAKTDETVSPGREYLENEEFDISDLEESDAQTAAVKELIDKCIKDGQDFIFIETPPYYRLYNDPVYQKYLSVFIDLLEERNVKYILASDVDFDNTDPENYEDMNHMSYKGRTLYTKELIKMLSK
ncbi:MAG: hypothetical protein K6B28_06055 [Lachnospiraceae bacterium]|nr:hypothetical protein [Lachnospiraceae bacterium]